MEKFVNFSEELRGGVEELDSQHEVLADLVNDLHRSIKLRDGGQAVREILYKLEDYSRIHFAVEESLMRILAYPGYQEHKSQHEVLVAQMSHLREKVSSGKQSISFELMHFLKSWLINHILVSDKDCSSFFLACGVQPQPKSKSWSAHIWDRLTA
jgi:hemerythrin